MSEVFGRYELIERIARGGMAEILLARQLTGARRVCAVKRILPAFSHDVRFVSMFIDEARITIGLAHDNIVRLLDFGQVDGSYFMAMEYVDGTDLASLLRAHTAAGTPLPPIVAAAIIRDVCRGLAHAHALTDAQRHPLNIVHRDVSPHNILLSSSGRVKLTDFGIAAARNKLSLTTPGTVLGKAAYMAPEQAQGLGIDFRTDLWAVGVILWEALAGERLFVAETPVRTLERVIADPILAPSTRRANIPMALDALTMTLLSRDPAGRPNSADDVVKALDVVVAQLARTSPLTTNGRFDDSTLAAHLGRVSWAEHTTPMRPKTPPASFPLPAGLDPVLLGHDIDDDVADADTRQRAALPSIVADSDDDDDAINGVFHDDAALRALHARLRTERDPWVLHDIAERAEAIGRSDVALSAWRTAAAIFSSRGQLVQLVVAHHHVRQRIGTDAADDELLTIADLDEHDDDALLGLLGRLDDHGFGLALLGPSLPPTTTPTTPTTSPTTPTLRAAPVPLLGALGPRELVKLANVVSVRRVVDGEAIINEGDAGDELFAVARGRVVVWCKPALRVPPSPSPPSPSSPAGVVLAGKAQAALAPLLTTPEVDINATADDDDDRIAFDPRVLLGQRDQKIFLAGLSDGDFFGEFSFLLERRRSATVEAVGDGLLLEIERHDIAPITNVDPAFTAPLHAFYKERVVELMMARSPVFSVLPPEARRSLLASAVTVDVDDGHVIVREGSDDGAFFFIRRGEVEVFREDDAGIDIFINKLGQGQFFGEIGALRGTPRSVNVRAIGPTTVFRIEAQALQAAVAADPRARALFDTMIARRTAEARARTEEHVRIFFGA